MNAIGYPLSSRPKEDPRKVDKKTGDETSHGALDKVESIFDIAKTQVSKKILKGADFPTIGSQEFDKAASAINFIKGFDPKNIAGAIPHALGIIEKMKSMSGKNMIPDDIFGKGFNDLLKQFTKAITEKAESEVASILEKIKKEVSEKIENVI